MNERLLRSESAFLREAAEQPILWYTWSEEAFKRAQEEDKPIVVDVGASWCHWCHVMDKLTYSDPEVAEIINRYFIPVKVDRDEMPDLDKRLQREVYAISGESGWPLTVFMTPDQRVFFGGTFFPPEDGMGRIGFRRLLLEISRIWRQDRSRILENLNRQRGIDLKGVEVQEDYSLVESAVSEVLSFYDWEYGGLGSQMKFPHPSVDALLLSHWFRTGDDISRKALLFTLKSMYMGGVMDQVGGGFHRYAVDREWWVPHFEKLLIDNAELMMDYLEAFTATGDLEVLDALELTYDFLHRDMKVEGGYANSIDADSEGIEGKYYTWTKEELKEALGDERARIAERLFSFNLPGGEVEGRKVLKRAYDLRDMERKLGLRNPINFLREVREAMLKYRDSRVRPFTDVNTYTHPNARAAEAVLLSSIVLGRRSEHALSVVNKLGKTVTRRLNGGKEGLLEDYASSLLAALAAYETSGNPKFLDLSLGLGRELKSFWNGKGFGEHRGDSEVDVEDRPNYSPNSLALRGLLQLSLISDDFPTDQIHGFLKAVISNSPLEGLSFVAGVVGSLDPVVKGAAHVVVIDGGDDLAKALHRTAISSYYPLKVVEIVPEGETDRVYSVVKAILSAGTGSRAYVCIGRTCSMPIREDKKLKDLLNRHN